MLKPTNDNTTLDMQWQFLLSLCFSGFRGVREQLQFTSVHSAWTPGLLGHQSLPSQVLCLDLSRGTLLQPVPHQDSADGFPMSPGQTHPASGDDDRVLLLQHLHLPPVPSHSLPRRPVLALRIVCIQPQERWAGPVCKENYQKWSNVHRSQCGREGKLSQCFKIVEILLSGLETWHLTIAVESSVSRCANTLLFVNVHLLLKACTKI